MALGLGYDRRKLNEQCNLDNEPEGVECILSASGAKLGSVIRKRFEENLSPDDTSFSTPDPASLHAVIRKHKDTVGELLKCDVQSDDSHSLGVPGVRRKTDLIRPQSARRFPEKDFDRSTSRFSTPRATSF